MARLTGPPVALEDIRDVREFARWRARVALGQNGHMTDAQRDDACDEAVALIYVLHERWDRERCAEFSAFLISYLDRALVDWWRRELRQSGRGTWSGSAGAYRYYSTISLDAEDRGDDGAAGDDDDSGRRVDRALTVAGPEG